MSRCVLLCEGPSILHVTPATLDGTTVIAVNWGALALPTRVDVFASQDPLSRFAKVPGAWAKIAAIPAFRETPPLALLARATRAESEPLLEGRWEVADLEVEATNYELACAGIGYEKALPTIAVAACWAAKRFDSVDIYGADFTGVGSPLTPWNPYREATERDADHDLIEIPRWGRERALMRAIMAMYPRIGRVFAPVGALP